MISCTFENGVTAGLRHVAVDVVLLNSDGEALLVKRSPELVEGGKWAIPGGMLDRDENVFTAARRELREETGYEAHALDFFALVSDPNRGDAGRQNVTVLFVAGAGEKVGEPDAESTDIAWYALDALPAHEETAFDHARILEMLYERQAFSGRIDPTKPVVY